MIEQLFATPVYHHTISPNELKLVSGEIEKALPNIRQSDLTNPWLDSVKTTFKYDGTNNDLAKHDLQALQELVFEHIGVYLEQLKIQSPVEVHLTESWFNFGGRGAYQSVHSHNTSTLSVVYYHQTNEQDGDICFRSPCAVHICFPLWKLAKTISTKEAVVYAPQVGKLLIFPSYLLHSVFENTTEHERISVAINFKVESKLEGYEK